MTGMGAAKGFSRMPSIVCSSHTISGVMPGSPKASRHSFADRVTACAEAGFTGMCLHFRDYAEQIAAGASDADLAAILADNGMAENSVEFLRDWFEPSAMAEANEDLAFRAAACFAAKFISVGADLDERNIPVASMGPQFARLCEKADDRGVAIALEIVAWSNVCDIDSALELLAFSPRNNAGLMVDAWHVFRGGISLSELKRLRAEQILCIQLNDAAQTVMQPLSYDTQNRKFCGEGDLDLGAFLDALAQIGVSAPLSVEVIAPEVAQMPLQDVARRAYVSTIEVIGASEMMAGSEH
jgi:sugar phosphate isomerase/epimerase